MTQEPQPVDHVQANVLEYARPVAATPKLAGWLFCWVSIGCTALFFLMYASEWLYSGGALFTAAGVGFATSLVAVFSLYRDWKGLVFSIFALTMNLLCIGIIAYLIYED